jgi:AcrR family transcriptional regulator
MAAAPSRPNYHHGDLRNALLETATELARLDGPRAVTVREVARRNGVSPSAAYRHFVDQQALITAVAHAVLLDLAARMRADVAAVATADPAEPAPDPAGAALERFRAVGLAYVDFALTHPGLFRTGYAPGITVPDVDDPVLPDHPLRVLGEHLDELVDLGLLAPEQRRFADVAAWSGVHGIAVLVLDGVLGAAVDVAPMVSATLDMIGLGLCGPALFGATGDGPSA